MYKLIYEEEKMSLDKLLRMAKNKTISSLK